MRNGRLSRIRFSLFVSGLMLCVSVMALADDASQEIDFVALAKSIVQNDAAQDAARERVSQLALAEQQGLLLRTNELVKAAESEKQHLKTLFDKNEEEISALHQKLEMTSGTLGEVFGVAKESALELIPSLEDSITSAQLPARVETLHFAQTSKVPDLMDLQNLYLALESEIQVSGRLAVFEAPVVALDGSTTVEQVLRIGTFSAIDEQGRYLGWDVKKQHLSELPTQPSGSMSQLPKVSANVPTALLVDPTRGQLFALLDREPRMVERIEQGGTIGYIIIALGLFGIVVGLYQLVRLLNSELGVRDQLNKRDISVTNPLGRVLKAVHDANAQRDSETLELKVDEAVIAELSELEKGQSFLKLLAAVAPLLGLLGTVVGMIATFQSISVFGTSDPKLMASGISQALMTTVLGLVVAVPILFMHSLLTSRSRRMVQILQQKSFGALGEFRNVPEPGVERAMRAPADASMSANVA